MIITCESCKTRFRLDPRLIKGLSTKVRCSRCQHVFFVSREDDLAIDQVILEPELPDREVSLGSKPPQFIPSRIPDQPDSDKRFLDDSFSLSLPPCSKSLYPR